MRPHYRFLRHLSQVCFATYCRGRVFGARHVPLYGGVLVVANHQSFLDPVLVGLAIKREMSYMARDSLFHNRFFGPFIASLNAFPVRRGAADVGAVKEALRRLKDGKAVVIFPEATRSADGSIGRINENSLAIAQRAGVPVAPVVVDGAFESWPRSRLLPGPATVHVTFAEPITREQVCEWPTSQTAQVAERRLRETLAASRIRRQRARRSNPPY